ADPIPLQKVFDDGCEKVVVILENPRTFVRQPQGMKPAYHFLLRKYPKMIEMIDNRHLRYRKTLKWVYEMEKEGRIFIFAPPENTGVSTSTKDFDLLQKLYDKGVEDYNLKREELISYLED
ncbi:MAG TPA: patatin family protein, partial [Methanocorpusculum sp.]|nr:patatin family protein [Methanocorpusculum sp.]